MLQSTTSRNNSRELIVYGVFCPGTTAPFSGKESGNSTTAIDGNAVQRGRASI